MTIATARCSFCAGELVGPAALFWGICDACANFLKMRASLAGTSA